MELLRDFLGSKARDKWLEQSGFRGSLNKALLEQMGSVAKRSLTTLTSKTFLSPVIFFSLAVC